MDTPRSPKTCCQRRNRYFTRYCRKSSATSSEPDRFRLDQNQAPACFDTFSLREPVSTSLENALERVVVLAGLAADAGKAVSRRFVLGAKVDGAAI